MASNKNLVLTGFMGTGKSQVGRALASELKRSFVDTDLLIEQKFKLPISNIFETMGEFAFRQAEHELCKELSTQQSLVISTGGGTLVSSSNFELLSQSGVVFCLDASIDTILTRINDDDRPLLAKKTRAQIAQLFQERQPAYQRIFHHVSTDNKAIPIISQEILERFQLESNYSNQICTYVTPPAHKPYPILVQNNLLADLPNILRWMGVHSKIAIVTEEAIFKQHGQFLVGALTQAQIPHVVCFLPGGESAKTGETVQALYQELLAHHIERRDTLIALGGGITGDLAGFVAATFMRGISFIQVPTTLLAMVDSSIGGKTGYDLPQGKNLIGAFKHPSAVLVDPQVLTTLPKAEISSGLAEVIKHAIINDPQLFEYLEENSNPDWSHLLPRAILVKANIVNEDPYEHGRRAVLNLGHTFGHALELLSDYSMRHGEAVGIGLVAACHLANELGIGSKELASRVTSLLKKHQLPTRVTNLTAEQIYQSMQHDKKREKKLRFIVPAKVGHVTIVEEPVWARLKIALDMVC